MNTIRYTTPFAQNATATPIEQIATATRSQRRSRVMNHGVPPRFATCLRHRVPKRFLYFLFDDWNVLTHTQDMRTRKQNTSASPECVGRVYHPAVNTHPRYPEWQALNSARSTEKQAQQLARTMLAWSKRQALLCCGIQSESSLVFQETGGRRFTLFAYLCIPQGYTKFEDFQTI